MLSQTEKGLTPFAVIGAISITTIIYKLSSFFYTYLRSGSIQRYNKNGDAWALVTGSSDGIGQALAHELCSKGFNIILHGRNVSKLSSVQKTLSSSFPDRQFRTLIADAAAPTATTSPAIRDLVATIKEDNLNLTVLVNNVGGTACLKKDFTALVYHTTKEIDDLISINMLFTTHLTHALLPLLTARDREPALILNTGSGSHTGFPYIAVYSATKGYLSTWGNALSMEMQAEGLEVEVVTVLSGNTQSGQDKRPSSLFRPSSAVFARAALEKVGCGKTVVVGYFWHAVQNGSVGALPEWALRRALIGTLKGMKGRDLDE